MKILEKDTSSNIKIIQRKLEHASHIRIIYKNVFSIIVLNNHIAYIRITSLENKYKKKKE